VIPSPHLQIWTPDVAPHDTMETARDCDTNLTQLAADSIIHVRLFACPSRSLACVVTPVLFQSGYHIKIYGRDGRGTAPQAAVDRQIGLS